MITIADRKLIVTIIGDDTSLQKALTRSSAATARFGKEADKNLRRGVTTGDAFAPLLTRTREMKAEAAGLSDSLEATSAAAGRAEGSMLGLLGRASLVGLAFNVAYQGSQRLQQGLTKTGEEAFTTAGRLSNMAAALMSADLIGAFQALSRQPKTLEELGVSAIEASNRMEALGTVARGVDAEIARVGDRHEGIESFRKATVEAGTKSQELARQLVNLVATQQAAEDSADALADATARLGTAFVTSTGQAVIFKGAVDSLTGAARGPGGVDAINAALAAAGGPTSGRIARPIGPTAKNAAAQVIAQAQGDLDELLRLQIIERDRLKKAVANSTGNVKQREALNAALAAATAAVIGTQKAIQAATDAAAATAKAAKEAAAQAAEAARRDYWTKIIGSLSIGVSRAELTKPLGDDLARLKQLKTGLEKQIAAGVDVLAAQTQLVAVEGQIAGKQQEIAGVAAAALQARQFRAIGLSATGGEITPGVENLRKQFRQLSENPELANAPKKLRDRLAIVGKALAGGVKDIKEPTREAINDLFQTIRGTFDTEAKRPLARHVQLSDAILKAVGLGKDIGVAARFDTRSLRPGAAAGAPAPVTISGPITVVADDPDAFLRQLQKKAGRTTATARGRFPGQSLGLG